MNRLCYRLVRHRTLATWVAVAEHCAGTGKGGGGGLACPRARRRAAGRSRRGSLRTLVALATLLPFASHAQSLPATTLPSGAQVLHGSATVAAQGAALTIQQHSERASLNWQRFDIGSGARVEFQQPSAQSIAINRVLGAGPSQIDGSLHANGQVFLLNPQGVLFGAGAQVDVGGLVAGSLSLDPAQDSGSTFTFQADPAAGPVINQGHLRATPGGYVVLAGSTVSNAASGTVTTPGGASVLAAGSGLELALDGRRLLSAKLTGAQVNALVTNAGLIEAAGGQVLLTAQGKDAALSQVINHSGVIRAQRLTPQDDGRIVLDGGSTGMVEVSGSLDASSATAQGGQIKVLGEALILRSSAQLSVDGATGGGTLLIGGNRQGLGPEPNARHVLIEREASLSASATGTGAGGSVIAWGTDTARVYGNLKATGGAESGAGGFIETSGHVLDINDIRIDASALHGTPGQWLIDPYNVTITNGGSDTGGSLTSNTWTPSTTGSSISNTTIKAALEAGNNVTITTTGAGAEAGDITVNGAITYAPGSAPGSTRTLTLAADGRITVNQDITSSAYALNLVMASNINGGTAGGITLNAGLDSKGGNITLGGGALTAGLPTGAAVSSTGRTIQINDVTLNAGAGNLSLLAQSSASDGLILGNATLIAGSLTAQGTSTTSSGGILFTGSNTFTNTAGGSFMLSGSSNSNVGIGFIAGSALSTSGNMTLSGTSGSSMGFYFQSGTSITSNSGNLNLLANTSSGYGIQFNGTTTLTNAGSGAFNFSGTSGTAFGVQNFGALSLANTGAGTLTLAGNSTSDIGLLFGNGSSLTNSGNANVSGISNSSIGLNFAGGNVVTANGGTLSLTGTSTSGTPISFTGANTITATGSASWSLNGNSVLAGDTIFGSDSGIITVNGTINADAAANLRGLSVISNGLVILNSAIGDTQRLGALSVSASTLDLNDNVAAGQGGSAVAMDGYRINVNGDVSTQGGALTVFGALYLQGGGTRSISTSASGASTGAAVTLTDSVYSTTDNTSGLAIDSGTAGDIYIGADLGSLSNRLANVSLTGHSINLGSTGSVATSLTPGSVTGLQLWLDASNTGSIVQSGGNVSQWTGQVNGINAVQATSVNQPKYGSATLNGVNVLSFDGASSKLTFTPVNGQTVLVVTRVDPSNSNLGGLIGNNGSDLGIRLNSTALPYPGNSNDFTNPSQSVVSFNHGLLSSGASLLDGWGVLNAKRGSGTAVMSALGQYYPGRYFKGDVAEVLVIDRALKGSESLGLDNYLMNKWGLKTSTAPLNIYSGGAISLNSPTVLNRSAQLISNTLSAASINGDGVVDRNLIATTASTLQLNGAVGATQRLGQINLTSGTTLTLNQNLDAGAQGAPVLLLGNALVLNGDISTAGGKLALAALSSATVGSGSTKTLNWRTTANGAAGGDVFINAVVNDSASGATSLVLDAGTGTIALSGDMGLTTPLASLTATAQNLRVLPFLFSLDPALVATRSLWLDASQASSIVQSGGLVSQWTGISGSPNATQGTASAQPTYGSTTLNGQNVVSFDGVNDQLNIAGLPGAKTVFSVMRADPSNGYVEFLGNGNDLGIRFSGNALVMPGDGNDFLNPGGSSARFNRSAVSSNPTLSGWGLVDLNRTGTAVGLTGLGHYSQPNRYFKGDVAEVVVFNRNLSSTEAIGIENYLSNKWQVGAALSLPNTTTLRTVGSLSLNGATQLGVNTTLSSTTGNVSVNGTLDADAAANARSLTISNSAGVTTINGAIGGVQRLGGLVIDAGDLTFNSGASVVAGYDGSSIRLSAHKGAQAGNLITQAITYSPATVPSSRQRLTLTADGTVNSNGVITTTGTPLDIIIASNTDNGTTGGVTLGSYIDSKGGDIIVGGGALSGGLPTGAATSTSNTGISFSSGGYRAISTGTGTLTMNGSSGSGTGIYLAGGDIFSNGAVNLTATSTSLRGLVFNYAGINGTGTVNATGISNGQTGVWIYNPTAFFNSGTHTWQISGVGNAGAIGVLINNNGMAGYFPDIMTSGAVDLIGTANGTGQGIALNNTFTSTNTGTFSLSGSANSNAGLAFAAGVTLTTAGAGSLNLSGTSNSGVGLYLGGANTLSANSGSLALTGITTSGTGVSINGAQSLVNAGTSTFRISGIGNASTGLQLVNGTSIASSGAVDLTGTTTTNHNLGVIIGQFGATGQVDLSATTGTLSLTGTSASTEAGLVFASGTSQTYNLSGTINVAGTSTSGYYGMSTVWGGGSNQIVLTNANVHVSGVSNGGAGLTVGGALRLNGNSSLSLLGQSTTQIGAYVADASLTNNGSGTLTLTGASNTSSGLMLNGSNQLSNLSTGSLSLAGTTQSGIGAQLLNNASLTSQGNVGLDGSTQGAGAGLMLGSYGAGSVTLSASAGTLALTGNAVTSAADAGLIVTGNGATYTLSGTVRMTGHHASSGYGVAAGWGGGASHFIFTNATAALMGDSSSGVGLALGGDTVFTQTGTGGLQLSGASNTGLGMYLGQNLTLQNATSSVLTLSGTSGQSDGLVMGNATVHTAGGVSLTGTSTAGTGLVLDNAAITADSGSLTMSGATALGAAVRFDNHSTVTSAGTADWTLLGNAVLGSDTVFTAGTGAMTINGTLDADAAANNRSLTVNSSGAVVFASAIGASQALGSLTTDANGSTSLRSVTTSGAQTYNDALTLNGDYLTTANGGNGAFTAAGPITLAGNTRVNTGTGSLALGTVQADDAALLRTLDLNTTGALSLGSVGTTQRVGSLVAQGGSVSLAGDIAATGLLSLSRLDGDLIIGGQQLSSSQGDVVLVAGASHTRGDASGGNVIVQPGSVITTGASGQLRIDTGGLASLVGLRGTVNGAAMSSVFTPGSGNFRYARQAGDAVGATGVGTATPNGGAAFVLFRAQPTLTVTPDTGQFKVYDGDPASDPLLTYTVQGVNGDTAAQALQGALNRAAGEQAGTYAITQSTLADQLGYRLNVDSTATFQIKPRTLIVRADDQRAIYGRALPALSLHYAGWASNDGLEQLSELPTANSSAQLGSAPGRYAIQAQGGAANNYQLQYESGLLTILPGGLNELLGLPEDQNLPNLARNEVATENLPPTVSHRSKTTLCTGMNVSSVTAQANSSNCLIRRF